ncbi:MAG TPA: AraC family transcriptional regulator [Proteobacteria bacterium]|nr:AraC family transcriptional regulator [Pseudomonadota bacterium]
MTTIQLEAYVKEQFNMGLYQFIKDKVEVENLYDYELAGILNVNKVFIGKLRKTFGMKKATKFPRQFERNYGAGAVERFKKIIENPDSTLAGVARHFGFSREYARQVYKKIYGCPYAEAFQSKRLARKRKRKARASRKKTKRLELLIRIREKMKSLGLTPHLRIRKHSYEILTNGYKLLLRYASTTVMIGKKRYFHITTGAGPDIDFVICLCEDNGEGIHYVIPRHAMPECGVYLLPEAGFGESKYARFKEAWHLLNHTQKPDKGGIMRAKDTKQPVGKTILAAVQSTNGPGVRPGYINCGSRLDHENSLKARLRAEIDLAIKGGRA